MRAARLKDKPGQAFLETLFEQTLANSGTLVRGGYNNAWQQSAEQVEWMRTFFPVFAELFALRQVQARTLLAAAFDTHSSNVGLQGDLHAAMTGRWFQPESTVAAYNPEQIFNAAVTVIQQTPSESYARPRLRSLRSMIHDGVVGAHREVELVDAAFRVWPSAPADAAAVLAEASVTLDPAKTAGLAGSTDLASKDAVEKLGKVWGHFARQNDLEAKVAFTRALLGGKSVSGQGRPDLPLGLWMDALGTDAEEALRAVLAEPAVTDEAARRVWMRSLDLRDSFSSAFFRDLALEILTRPGLDLTRKALLDHRSLVSRLLGESFGLELLRVFPRIATDTTKAEVPAWIKEVAGEKYFRAHHNLRDLSDADFAHLHQTFKGSKLLQKAQDALRR